MKIQAPTPHADVKTALDKARACFGKGEVHATWSHLQGVLATPDLPEPLVKEMQFLQLGCAVYGVGDLAAANALNAVLPVTSALLPLRYRLAIRQRQIATAKWLRRSDIATFDPKFETDFKNSVAHYCLWHAKVRTGLTLYPNRVGSILFPKIVPKSLQYAPLPKDRAKVLPRIIIEQGVGDAVFHLCHIRQMKAFDASTFIGHEKFRSLVQRWFPKGRFEAIDRVPDDLRGTTCHLAGDFLSYAWSPEAEFRVNTLPEQPRRGAMDAPLIGICWRGGSGQNRRDERHIPLAYFLDLLPEDGRFVTLQFDLTDQEREILASDRRVMTPLLDITESPLQTIDMIRDLAGVISVDSANWHFAGASDVPFLAIMNKTAHWFWGSRADAKDTYQSATNIPKQDLNASVIRSWVAQAKTDWEARPCPRPASPAVRRARPAQFHQPLFVVSLPRSRSSMVMRAFAQQGVWLGRTVGPTRNNPHGFFENEEIRETYLKGVLKQMGADPLGVRKLPPLVGQPPFPHLAARLRKTVTDQGYISGPWGFKDPKLTLLWPMWAKAFPQAQWLILTRNEGDVVQSLCRTSFMARHSTSPEFWKMFCVTQNERLDALRQRIPGTLVLDTDALIAGETGRFAAVLDRLGLDFNDEALRASMDAKLLRQR